MRQFWVGKIFDVVLALLGYSVIRHYVKRFYPRSYERVLDAIVSAVLIIGIIITWRIAARDVEAEDFRQLVTRAYSDETTAIDELHAIAETPTHHFRDAARGVVDGITRISITFPKNPALVEQLKEFSHAELLRYYRQTPQHSAFVLGAIGGNKHMTEDDKANFMALMTEDARFRVVSGRAYGFNHEPRDISRHSPQRSSRCCADMSYTPGHGEACCRELAF
jgi:hypothetical protein